MLDRRVSLRIREHQTQALAVRAPRRPGVGNVWLGGAVALSAALMLAGAYAGPLQNLLGTSSLGLSQLGLSVVASVVPGLVVAATNRARPFGTARTRASDSIAKSAVRTS